MTATDKHQRYYRGHRVILTMALCFFVIGTLHAFLAPRKAKKKPVDNKVYLLHADELRYDMAGPNPDAQIAKGHVAFKHQGAFLN